eukprot:1159445-Pelagomonas_calceolata.AAC.18
MLALGCLSELVLAFIFQEQSMRWKTPRTIHVLLHAPSIAPKSWTINLGSKIQPLLGGQAAAPVAVPAMPNFGEPPQWVRDAV